MEELIITIRGDIQPRNKCRLIKQKYYLIDRDCVYSSITTIWHRTAFKSEAEVTSCVKRHNISYQIVK